MEKIFKTKTFWGGVSTVVVAVGGIFSNTISIPDAVQMIATGVLAIFIRDGIRKEKYE